MLRDHLATFFEEDGGELATDSPALAASRTRRARRLRGNAQGRPGEAAAATESRGAPLQANWHPAPAPAVVGCDAEHEPGGSVGAVFISYAASDAAKAREVQERLAAHGHRSVYQFMDPTQGTVAGEVWERTLYAKLRSCQALIALNSVAYLESKWSLVEISQARAQDKPIFPLRIDDSPLHERLSDRHAIDLRGPADALAEAFGRLLRGLHAAGVVHGGWDGKRPPYPGLLAFEEDDAPVFFGREAATEAALERLRAMQRARTASWFVLVGASGSGKSSLLRAGVVPRLREDSARWLVAGPFTPGPVPEQRFALALSETFGRLGRPRDWKQLRSVLLEGSEAELADLAGDLRAAANAPEATVLIAVDQADELLSFDDDRSEQENGRSRFVGRLRALADLPDRPFLVVATLRSDVLGAFQDHPRLRDIDVGYEVVAPIERRALAEVVEGPARLAAVALEPGLVDEIVRDTETRDALPLLAFTLHDLHERHGGDHLLTLAEYRALGGLERAVADAAERTLAESRLEAPALTALRRALLALVRLGDRDQPVRRPAMWDELPAQAHGVLERFVDARLLVTSGEGSQRAVGVAHEALFRSWPALREWIAAARDLLGWRRRMEPLLDAWERSKRAPGSLLAGHALDEARVWLSREGELLSEAERALIETSEARARATFERERRRNRRLALVGFTFVAIVSVLVGVSLQQWRAAQASTLKVRASLIVGYSDATPEPTRAATMLRELPATVEGSGRAAFDILGGELAEAVFTGHRDAVLTVALSPDGKRVFSASSSEARLWHADGSGEPKALDGVDGVRSASFDEGGSRLVTAGRVTQVWATDGSSATVALKGLENAAAVAISGDGRKVVGGGQNGDLIVGNADGSGAPVELVRGAAINWVAIDRDGRHVIAYTADGALEEWDVDSAQPRLLGQHPASARLIAASRDAGTVAFRTDDAVQIVRVGAEPQEARTLSGEVVALVLSARNVCKLAASDKDGRIKVGGAGVEPLLLYGDGVVAQSLAFSRDGSRLVVGGPDGSLKLWNLAQAASMKHGGWKAGRPRAALPSPDGKHVASVSLSGAIEVWNADHPGKPIVLDAPDAVRESGFVYLADRARGWSDEGAPFVGQDTGVRARPWFTPTPSGPMKKPISVYPDDRQDWGRGLSAMAFSRDGTELATGDWSGAVRVFRADGSKSRVLQERGAPIYSLAFSPDDRQIMAVGRDHSVRLWPARGSGAEVVLKGHTGPIYAAAFNPNGTRIATGSADHTIRVWTVGGTGSPIVLAGHEGTITSLEFSADGTKLVSGSVDGTARVWSADGSVKPIALHRHGGVVSDVAFAKGGESVVTASARDNTARVWKSDGRGPPAVLDGPIHGINAVAVSPTDNIIALGSWGQVQLWDPDRPSTPVLLRMGDKPITTVQFSRDGTRILATSLTQEAWIVHLDWRTQLWRRTPFCLPAAERSARMSESEAQAEIGEAECRKLADRCRPERSSLESCAAAIEARFGPLPLTL